MRFLIDSREAFSARRTGKGVWTRGFIEELITRGIPVTLLGKDGQDIDVSLADVQTFLGGMRWHFKAARFARMQKDNCVYVSPTSFIVPALLGGRMKVVPIVHDLIAFQEEPHDRKAKFLERLLLRRALQSAAHVCTVSEATRQDVLERFSYLKSEDISVIYAGPLEEAPEMNHPDGKTILCAATLCPRKNQLRLIQAFTRLPVELQNNTNLVLIGARGWQDQEIVDLAEKTLHVEYRSYVPDSEYIALLRTCTVFAFPSLYEGFALPVLDAMQRGIPVLTSDRGSLKEVAGSAALTVDPESMESIAEGLETLLSSSAIRTQLREAGPKQAAEFHWKKTVDLFLESLKPLL